MKIVFDAAANAITLSEKNYKKEFCIMSIIEDAFRLDKAGGVYFEGARVQPMPKEIALFVGLGGTGNEALLHVKNQIHNRMHLF